MNIKLEKIRKYYCKCSNNFTVDCKRVNIPKKRLGVWSRITEDKGIESEALEICVRNGAQYPEHTGAVFETLFHANACKSPIFFAKTNYYKSVGGNKRQIQGILTNYKG